MKLAAAEKNRRSIIKSISYRILSISVDSVVAYFFTKNVYETVSIVAFVNFYSTILYYFHERIWTRVTWGMKK